MNRREHGAMHLCEGRIPARSRPEESSKRLHPLDFFQIVHFLYRRRIGNIDAGLIGSQVELVRQAFHESFAAAFTGTLRLNLIWPIAIAILVAITLRSKEAKTANV